MSKARGKMTKKTAIKAMPSMPFKRSEFSGRHDIQKARELYVVVRGAISKLLDLPFIRHKTQHEEMLRSFMFILNTRDISKLPYDSNGIGSRDNNVYKALLAEVSCLVVAYWNYLSDMIEPLREVIYDHVGYLDHLCRDTGTIRTMDLGNCRYRLVNNRIINGFKMNEHEE